MALNINGTTGISGVDGTVSAPALTGTDSNTGINFGSDTVNINTGGSTRATVNSSGNLGVGTTSPTARFDVRRGDTDGLIAEFHQSGGYGIDIGSSQSIGYIASGYGQDLAFKTDPSSGQTERMRLLSSGSLCIGVDTTANSEKMRIDSTGSTGTVFLRHGSVSYTHLTLPTNREV